MIHRTDFRKESPFRPHFRAFYPHPAHGSSLRVSRGILRHAALEAMSVGELAARKGPPTFWNQGKVGGRMSWRSPRAQRKTRRESVLPVACRVRRACDDAPLSFPVCLCDAPYLPC